MDWNRLLSPKRLRELRGGEPSTRAESEHRDEFARDYGRLVFSTPVRRLLDKTQVFPLDPSDSVRTRLTHSMEVSSVASSLAELAARWLVAEGECGEDVRTRRVLPTIAGACALVHDIGNPPFGHAGELAIQTWMEGRLKSDQGFRAAVAPDDPARPPDLVADFLKFEGNAQTIRLLSRLQILIDFHGINLTAASLSAACKYTASSTQAEKNGPHERRKPGFFYSERDVIQLVRETTGTGDARNPITYLVEAADDTVYAPVDIEDGIRKGLLTWKAVRESLEEGARSPLTDRVLNGVDRAIARTELNREPRDHEIAPLFRTFAIGELVDAALSSFKNNYQRIMEGEFHEELLGAHEEAGEFLRVCKDLVRTHVYTAPQILELELLGRRVIHDLMDVFWEGAQGDGNRLKSYADRSLRLLSENYRNVFERAVEQDGLDETYARLQLVTDHVSGMTDTYACSLHARLFGRPAAR